MDNKTFSVGDTVIIKSGGPGMTVLDKPTGEHLTCKCAWFDGDHQFHSEVFPAASLVAVDRQLLLDIGL